VDLIEAGLDLIIIGFVLNPVVDMVAFIVFAIWFSHHDISLMSSRNVLRTLATFVGKFVPVISLIPLWTVCVVYTITSHGETSPFRSAQQMNF
jgi:hypothetical protein